MSLLILKKYGRDELRIIRLSTSSTGISAEDLHPPFAVNRARVDAVCKGLVCLYYEDGADYFLWNPATGKCKVIPTPNLDLTPCDYAQYHTSCVRFHYFTNSGLGFDPITRDYKFIKFTCISYANDEHETHSFVNQISVYSLKKNSWKEISNPERYSSPSYFAVSLDGACYWLADSYIIVFDLATDELSTLPFPDIIVDKSCEKYLIEYYGVLYFVICSWFGDSKCLRFWMMNVEDGGVVWVRKEELFVCGRGALRPLGFCKDGRSFLLEGRDGTLLEYDFLAREMKSIEEIFDNPFSMRLYSYIKSNVKLNEGDDDEYEEGDDEEED